jgi:transcription antitermination factor NusB
VGRRSKARECAFQILYQWEISKEPIDGVIDAFWRVRSGTAAAREMAERLARGAQRETASLDAMIEETARNWRLERIAAVDKNILRLGAYELTREATPPLVVIDEAIEIAKRFGEADSPAFVNGVLDAIMKKVKGTA